ncbi:MAG: hypothetical protein OEY38_21615, partial [Gammaproteobacteria bacterium]|nr:hypothetical protein [Gammaproteobacteria bacterium]
MSKYPYVVEKLGLAVETLATGKDDVRSRLNDAFLSFHTLNKDDFPAEFQKDWEWVLMELTKFGPVL